MSVDWDRVRDVVSAHVDQQSPELRRISQALHANPELAYQESFAHDAISDFLQKQGFAVGRRAHGLDTSFEATAGSGRGRLVIVCAEYDALPSIGHACGHNLIAASSLGAFLGAAHAMRTLGIGGRVRILGTPAEEGGGGKVKLLQAGAFSPPEGVAACIMAHPIPAHALGGLDGLAALDILASHKFRVEFRGRAAHAAAEPWIGANALDAAVGAYTNVSMLRQHIRPEERVHGVVEVGGTVPNVIPDYTRMNWYVRAPTTAEGGKLEARVRACIDAAAAAAGCTNNYIPSETYKHVINNPGLCEAYVGDMAKLGGNVVCKGPRLVVGSTDMGNVSHEVPGFHGAFGIPADPGAALHSIDFASAAGKPEAHECAMKSAKGMAMLALRVIADHELAARVRLDFEEGNAL
ncbi:uncharacterized protein UV8b_06231 [Ustilaginoidea virens]|uniref:Peptidase M20 domain-containing protein 2 n=1 Tax=Ustilaginoidea virens TaxID=1159556 RepID=A0A063BX99_USTVR|nr:uncharacterized protein UV8b_06231 [Ustilaginoidea virens]QUC21990.1 hypothetical protein UV8b_06231 [Ustilaginoidea virens]GAO19432.1 hypothetical protein UVI_02023310 [Ustilaginoidea virens]